MVGYGKNSLEQQQSLQSSATVVDEVFAAFEPTRGFRTTSAVAPTKHINQPEIRIDVVQSSTLAPASEPERQISAAPPTVPDLNQRMGWEPEEFSEQDESDVLVDDSSPVTEDVACAFELDHLDLASSDDSSFELEDEFEGDLEGHPPIELLSQVCVGLNRLSDQSRSRLTGTLRLMLWTISASAMLIVCWLLA